MIDITSFTTDLLNSVQLFLPETTLVVTFLAALFADLLVRRHKHIAGYVAVAGFAVAAYFLAQQTGIGTAAFSGLFVVDSFGQFIRFVILISSMLVVIFSFFSDELHHSYTKLGEYYMLIIGMVFGMFLLAGSSNLILIYLAIETMSISSYILTGYIKEAKRATEASLKYVIFGAVSSGVMIYGISMLFGLTGTLNLSEINAVVAGGAVNTAPLLISGLMILAGFAYKISAAPFHFWTPDVYEGAPVTITALLSVASKAAGFGVLIRFFKVVFTSGNVPGTGDWALVGSIDWHLVLAVLAVLTMSIGNLVALWQTNIKRMLAYSSIAHAGYLLMAVAMLNDTAVSSVLIYFFVYMLMNLGAFLVVQVVADKAGTENIDDYSGMGYRNPLIGVALTILLISLTGLPPTAGFIGKLYVFSAVVNAGWLWLAAIGVLNSVVSLYYYAKVIRNMYLRNVESKKSKLTVSPVVMGLILALAALTLVFGLYFSPMINWANSSVQILSGF